MPIAQSVPGEAFAILPPNEEDAKDIFRLIPYIDSVKNVTDKIDAARSAIISGNLNEDEHFVRILKQLDDAYEFSRIEGIQIRGNISSLGWRILREQSGIERYDCIKIQYRELSKIIDLESPDFEIKEESMWVQNLSVSTPSIRDFRLIVSGVRLLKNGKPGKVHVEIPVRDGLTVRILKHQPPTAKENK